VGIYRWFDFDTSHSHDKTFSSYIEYKGQITLYSGAAKSLARPGRKQATAAEDFDVHISYLQS
jgi:hypothetical protein